MAPRTMGILDGSASNWVEVSKGNRQARRMADRHYSFCQQAIPGAQEVGPPGQKLVLLTTDGKALWGSHRPAPWADITRADGLCGLFCFVFRNEGYPLTASSALIREAVAITVSRWGPADFWTYIGVEHVHSNNPGWCFLRAGFEHHSWGQSAKLGKLRLLKMPASVVQECMEDLRPSA